MRAGVRACDLGVSQGEFGACSIDTSADPPRRPPLTAAQRGARAVAGVGFLGLAALLGRTGFRHTAVVPAWFGATHLLAAGTAFNGCPELGAVPSAVLRREVATECGPWEWIDARLGLGDSS